jgi:hypothetical protein
MKKRFTWVMGDSGHGKTLYVKEMVAARIRVGGRSVVVDPNGVFTGYGTVVSIKAAVDRLAKVKRGEPFALVVRPGWGEKLGPLWPRVYQAGHLLLVVDEAQRVASAARIDRDFLFLVTTARNNYVDIATTSQGPKTLHPEIRGLFDVGVHFRQKLQEYADDVAVTYFQDRRFGPALMRLPQFHFLRATADGNPPTAGRLPDPKVHPPSPPYPAEVR